MPAAPPTCSRNENVRIDNVSFARFVIRPPRRRSPRRPKAGHSCLVILIMSLLVVGSIAIDTVKTPVEEQSDLLGGSASYAELGASFFWPVRLVGVVSDDVLGAACEYWKSGKTESECV